MTLEVLMRTTHNDTHMAPFLLVNQCSINVRDNQTALKQTAPASNQIRGSRVKYALKARTSADFTTFTSWNCNFSSLESWWSSAVGVE